MTRMLSRAGRAALFDRKVFTEAFFDDDAAADGAIVVALTGAATYVGALLWNGVLAAFSITALLQVLIASVASWLILAFATWFTTTRLFGAQGRPQTMIAMQGLTVLPLLLEIVGGIVSVGGLIWYLGVLVVATREASDLDFRKAGVSVLIGFAAAALIRALLRVPFTLFGVLG